MQYVSGPPLVVSLRACDKVMIQENSLEIGKLLPPYRHSNYPSQAEEGRASHELPCRSYLAGATIL